MRDPAYLSRKFARKWKKFIANKKLSGKRRGQIASASHQFASVQKKLDEDAKKAEEEKLQKESEEKESDGKTKPKKKGYPGIKDSQLDEPLLKDAKSNDVKINIADSATMTITEDEVIISEEESRIVGQHKIKASREKMCKPRKIGADGNEEFDQGLIRKIQCEQITEVDASNPWERHWKLECEYEKTVKYKPAFQEYDMFTGKDEIHQTFLEKLFGSSKHSVGKLRGNFFAYKQEGKMDKKEEKKSQNFR